MASPRGLGLADEASTDESITLRVYPPHPLEEQDAKNSKKLLQHTLMLSENPMHLSPAGCQLCRGSLHGRKIGHSLSIIRNLAIICREGYPYIPDGWRDIARQQNQGLHLLNKG